MAYTNIDFPTKKAFKEAVAKGERITLVPNFIGPTPTNGRVTIEGPQYPKPHRWYATAIVRDGQVVLVK